MEGHRRIAWGVAYHPRGAWLASSGGETHVPGEILLWDSITGRRLRSLPEVPEGLISLAIDPDGNLLATGSQSGTIRVWDAKNGQLVWARRAPGGGADEDAERRSATVRPGRRVVGLRASLRVRQGVDSA
jgi:WD40 repeat protein